MISNPESWLRSNIFNYSYNQRQRSFPNRELPYFFQMEQNFSKLPYKREKIFPTQKYWLNRPILMLTFFCFDILKLTDTFITDKWGEREDSQKVLVAICTLVYFSWLYTFIFFRCFSINRLLWNLFCLYHEREYFFSKLHYKQGKNNLGLKIALS